MVAARRLLHSSARCAAGGGREVRNNAKIPREMAKSSQTPTPSSRWDHPLYRAASRRPFKALPKTPGDSSTPNAQLKVPTLKQRETYRAMELDFRAHGTTVLGGKRSPTLRIEPPVALPKTFAESSDSTNSLRQRLEQLKGLRDTQITKGDYAPFLRGAALRSKHLQDAQTAKSAEEQAVIQADDALSKNTTMHPIARRFVMERIGSQLKVAC
ncbi:hypothetical protein MYAM1_002603 [Malassezia yamatoensis]|uniref:Uncharacterized protein n=1 Tax=Malassezia yamatoensis TaxID=253288 RepID=A0AAJ5YU82_9BASI|nr:hypothetical protein MYAM1_002603 [Malassezia yamatoensis]